MMRAILALCVAALAACETPEPTQRDLDRIGRDYQRRQAETGESAPVDSCGMAAHAHLIGQSAASIDRASLPAGARVVCLGCAVTMDYSPSRLNLMLDAQEEVDSLRCG